MLEKLKQHPYLYGGIAAVVILIVIYYSESSSTAGSSDSSSENDAALNASTQLAEMQMQLQGASQQQSAELEATQDNDATSLSEYTLQQQTTSNANSLAAQVAELEANLSATTTQQANTLQAGVDTAQIQGEVTDYQTLANALISESNNQTAVAIAGINANKCNFFCF